METIAVLLLSAASRFSSLLLLKGAKLEYKLDIRAWNRWRDWDWNRWRMTEGRLICAVKRLGLGLESMADVGGEINGGFSMDSTESRWVFQEDDEYDEDASGIEDYAGDLRLRGHAAVPDSEEEDTAEQKLIRTGPRVDSFDVEALDVPGAHRNDYEDINLGKKIVLAF